MNTCPKCDFEVQQNAKFCVNCGNRLVQEEAAEPERRRVAVLFSDLVEFTNYSGSVEDDEVAETLEIYQNLVKNCVTRRGGHIAQFLGDGVLVYFGYPSALENAAEHAIQAGLDIINAIVSMTDSGELQQRVRVGIHQGSGVITNVGDEGRLLVGNTPNIASRMQHVAEPNSLVISDETHAIVKDQFECESLGLKKIKGLPDELEVYRVKSHKDLAQFEIKRQRGLGKLAGRKKELDWLDQQTNTEDNKAILISADAGMGKSRLLHEFEQHTSPRFKWYRQRCSEYRQDTPLEPVRGFIKKLIGIYQHGKPKDQQVLISAFLDKSNLSTSSNLDLLCHFLSVDFSKKGDTADTNIEELLFDIVRYITADGPVLFFLDDIHWADRSTLNLIKRLIDIEYKNPFIIVMTTRPSLDETFLYGFAVNILELESLGLDAVKNILEDRLSHKVIRAEVIEHVSIKSGGNPLYVEELITALVNANGIVEINGQIRLDETQAYRIPNSLHDALALRIDQLGSARKVAQVASVLGREFEVKMLKTMLDNNPDSVDEDLEKLRQLEIIEAVSSEEEITRFIFSHDLIRDVIYESLVRQQREKYHRGVAGMLEDNYSSFCRLHPEILGLHWHAAGEHTTAIEHYKNACENFTGQGAHTEAAKLCRLTLDLVRNQPKSPERDRMELGLLIMLAASMNSTDGYATPEKFSKVLEPALRLCEKLGTTEESVPICYQIYSQKVAQAHKSDSDYWRDRTVAAVQHQRGKIAPYHELAAQFAIATCAFWKGDFTTSINTFDELLMHYDKADHKYLMRTYGEDFGLFSRNYRQWAYVFIGEVDRAREEAKNSREIAESMNEPQVLMNCLNMSNHIYRDLGEVEQHLEIADLLIRYAERYGSTFYYVAGYAQRNWALPRLGREQEAFDTRDLNLTGMDLMQSVFARDQAELLLQSSEYKTAKEMIDFALAVAEKNLDCLYLPDLYRVKGDIQIKKGDKEDGAKSLRKGLELAHKFEAQYWAVKCALHLAYLIKDDNPEQAHKLLSAEMANVTGFGDCLLYKQANETLQALIPQENWSNS